MSTSRASRAGGGVVAGATTIYLSSKGAGPNSTAAQNTLAIQAALNACNTAGGGTVVLDKPGVWTVGDLIKTDSTSINATLNSALVIYSNTTLMLADGVTIKLANGSNVYTIRNARSGHASLRDSNISIVGGKIDGNYTNQNVDSRDNAGKIYWKFHTLWFDQVDGLRMQGVEMVGGKKFCAWFTRATRVRCSDIYIHDTNSDGLHVGGGCTDVVIRDSRFVGCPDNATPIITNEGGYYPTVGGSEAQYLDAPHGPTRQVAFINNEYPGCEIAPVRLAGGTGTVGTDNIEDVLVDGCTGSTQSGSAVEIIDDTVVSPNINGALVRNVTVRNCRFVTTNDASGYANGFMVYANATGVRDLRLENCTNTDLGFSLTGATSGGGANATAFIEGEVVTESGTGATGYYRNEAGGKIHVYPRTGTFTGASTPTYTGGTSGAVRYNGSSTAPAILGQNLLYVGARSTGVETITVNNCVDKKAYRGTVYVVASAVVGQLTISGGAYTLGLDGKLLQIDGTVNSSTISGAVVTGPSVTSSSAVVRIGSSAVATRVAITGNTLSGLSYIIDQSSGTLVNVNLSGNTLTGYGANQSVLHFNRSSTAQTYIGGDGNVFTDRPSGGGGWYINGILTASTSTGYVRVNNPSLWIQGSAILAGTPPSMNDRRGDRFFNTDTAGSGAWFTAYGNGLYGQVICADGVYKKHGW